MMKKRTLYAKNSRGVEIKKCCASCEHIAINNHGFHTCRKMLLNVNSDFCCPEWSMAANFINVGDATGKVKSAKYLNYVKLIREEESELIRQGAGADEARKPISLIRQEYEQLYGSIYCLK